ncbi:BatD family protein [Algivirga pacifica]|uniref:BatD family protein n=1 Tax=Algivirga pacifica TaxID=1162670 RepID=A0ABP9D5M0_9BACT
MILTKLNSSIFQHRFWWLTLLAWGLSIGILKAQQISIELGNSEIGENEYYRITLKVQNGKLKSYSGFPDIKGFTKGRPSSSYSTNIINGAVSSSHSIIQEYRPSKQGTFRLRPFTITANGQKIKSNGATIKVGPAKQAQAYDPFDPFGGFPFFRRDQQDQEEEFVEVKDDAFFAITTDKSEVYRGEGFNLTIAWYEAVDNKARLDFYKLLEQLTEIKKTIQPKNCWEENFDISSIHPEYVQIRGKAYRKHKIYEATFYPLNEEDITIPSVGLEMIKYKVSKRASFFGRRQKQDFKTYYSKAKTIKVKALPAHPLKDVVSVGNFRLKESTVKPEMKTGESISYKLSIQGEGNILTIPAPTLKESDDLLFYEPGIIQNINRSNGKVFGEKSFNYYIEPQEAGNYSMKDYLSWTYFNPRTHKYEQLIPEAQFNVTGKSLKDSRITENQDAFYQQLEEKDNTLKSLHTIAWPQYIMNALVLLALAGGTYVMLKK